MSSCLSSIKADWWCSRAPYLGMVLVVMVWDAARWLLVKVCLFPFTLGVELGLEEVRVWTLLGLRSFQGEEMKLFRCCLDGEKLKLLALCVLSAGTCLSSMHAEGLG